MAFPPLIARDICSHNNPCMREININTVVRCIKNRRAVLFRLNERQSSMLVLDSDLDRFRLALGDYPTF